MKKGYLLNPINLIGLIVVAVTVGVFFLLVPERTAINWWALFFVLLSEVVLFTAVSIIRILKEQANKVFFGSGASVTLTLYFLLTLVSCSISNLFKDRINFFITIEILIFALTVILLVIFASLSKRINQWEK